MCSVEINERKSELADSMNGPGHQSAAQRESRRPRPHPSHRAALQGAVREDEHMGAAGLR